MDELENYKNKPIFLFTKSSLRFSGKITDTGTIFLTFLEKDQNTNEYKTKPILIALDSIEKIKEAKE